MAYINCWRIYVHKSYTHKNVNARNWSHAHTPRSARARAFQQTYHTPIRNPVIRACGPQDYQCHSPDKSSVYYPAAHCSNFLSCRSASFSVKLTKDEKICWLISHYSFTVVAKVCSFLKCLPSALTEKQQISIMQEELPMLSAESISKMLSFITSQLSDAIPCFSARDDIILSPPVDSCYECQQLLSPYNSCQLRCYTTTGAMHGHKFTLRCTRKLFYNYTQYGNKHELGFRYYPSQRGFVEASDTTYIERNLLELQCSHA